MFKIGIEQASGVYWKKWDKEVKKKDVNRYFLIFEVKMVSRLH